MFYMVIVLSILVQLRIGEAQTYDEAIYEKRCNISMHRIRFYEWNFGLWLYDEADEGTITV
jgi:hypothetical protein